MIEMVNYFYDVTIQFKIQFHGQVAIKMLLVDESVTTKKGNRLKKRYDTCIRFHQFVFTVFSEETHLNISQM